MKSLFILDESKDKENMLADKQKAINGREKILQNQVMHLQYQSDSVRVENIKSSSGILLVLFKLLNLLYLQGLKVTLMKERLTIKKIRIISPLMVGY